MLLSASSPSQPRAAVYPGTQRWAHQRWDTNDGHHATAIPGDDATVSPVKELRRLFASLPAGKEVRGPGAVRRSPALETGTQQDGQEFLKLLLTYLERVAGERWGRGKDATFVQTHFRGQSSYATVPALR